MGYNVNGNKPIKSKITRVGILLLLGLITIIIIDALRKNKDISTPFISIKTPDTIDNSTVQGTQYNTNVKNLTGDVVNGNKTVTK